MTPLTLPAQVALESRVSAGPGVPVWTYCDYWGTLVSVFDIGEPHESLTVARPGHGRDRPGARRPAAGAALGGAAGRGRAGLLLEFLLPTPLTTVAPAVAATVLDAVHGADPAEAAEEIAARVRAQVRYMAGATEVLTNAQEAWDQGQGVCQDMAHVTVALLRAAGLPARYVSGYLHADPAAEPGQTAVGESHAWVEYWAGSWRPCDPTSGAAGAGAARGGGQGPRLRGHPAAQGHLPRRAGPRGHGDRRGHPAGLTPVAVPADPPPGSRESSSRDDGLSRCSPETCVRGAPRMPGPEGRHAMSIGPVEYIILGFPGNNFTGQIVPELAKLIDSGLVRIIDLTFISERCRRQRGGGRVRRGRGAGGVRRPRRRGGRDSHRRRRRPRRSEPRAEHLSSAAHLGGHLGGPVRGSGTQGQRSHPRRRANPARGSSNRPWTPWPTPSPETGKPAPSAPNGPRRRRQTTGGD